MNETVGAGLEAGAEEVVGLDPREELTKALRKCTPKQRAWLRALPDHNHQRWATSEALGISKSTLHRWLRMPNVKRALELIDEVAVGDLELTNRRILQEYARIAFADIRGVLDVNGTLRDPGDWPDDVAAAVSAIETEERSEGRGDDREFYTVRKVKTHSKLEALKALAAYKKLIAERHELTGPDGEPLNAPPPIVNVIIGGKKD